MTTSVKTLGWAVTVAAAHIAFILGWTLAIGIGGALLITAGFALIDWIIGIAKWDNAYAAHLGQITSALMMGLTLPVGAALGVWRFQVKRSRTFNTYSLDDAARLAVTLLCTAVGGLLIAATLCLAGGAALRAVEAVEWAGAASGLAELARKLRWFPLLLFSGIVLALAEQARRK